MLCMGLKGLYFRLIRLLAVLAVALESAAVRRRMRAAGSTCAAW